MKLSSVRPSVCPSVSLSHHSAAAAGLLLWARRAGRYRLIAARWYIKLWDITSLGSVQVVGFFDVAAHLCAGDGPIAALVGGSSCSIGFPLQHRTFNDYKNNIAVYTLQASKESHNSIRNPLPDAQQQQMRAVPRRQLAEEALNTNLSCEQYTLTSSQRKST